MSSPTPTLGSPRTTLFRPVPVRPLPQPAFQPHRSFWFYTMPSPAKAFSAAPTYHSSRPVLPQPPLPTAPHFTNTLQTTPYPPPPPAHSGVATAVSHLNPVASTPTATWGTSEFALRRDLSPVRPLELVLHSPRGNTSDPVVAPTQESPLVEIDPDETILWPGIIPEPSVAFDYVVMRPSLPEPGAPATPPERLRPVRRPSYHRVPWSGCPRRPPPRGMKPKCLFRQQGAVCEVQGDRTVIGWVVWGRQQLAQYGLNPDRDTRLTSFLLDVAIEPISWPAPPHTLPIKKRPMPPTLPIKKRTPPAANTPPRPMPSNKRPLPNPDTPQAKKLKE